MRYILVLLWVGTALAAQSEQGFGLSRDVGILQYQFQLRGSRAGSAFRELTGNQVAGGGGFLAVIGETPLRLRLRLDGDYFPSQNGQPQVSSQGLGVEAFLLFPSSTSLAPYLSLGPTFQHWEFGRGQFIGQAPQSSNRLGSRLEAGLWFKGRWALAAGLFYGTYAPGETATDPYLAITIQF